MSPRCSAASHVVSDQFGASGATSGMPTRPSIKPESQESPPPISSTGRCSTYVVNEEIGSPPFGQTMDHRSCKGGSFVEVDGSLNLQVTAKFVRWPRRCCTAFNPLCRQRSSSLAPSSSPLGMSTDATPAASLTLSSLPMLTRSPIESTSRSSVPMCGSTISQRSSHDPKAGRWLMSKVTISGLPTSLRRRAAFNAFHHALCVFDVICGVMPVKWSTLTVGTGSSGSDNVLVQNCSPNHSGSIRPKIERWRW
mmetsp:Transcript_41449/g.81983  ORF Transcript_41449/g.81983 Transcript_41449/m.81983 type:complete len:252 (+) Transcript_41449:160-915(+)